jgi:hypothetical protein
MTAMSFVLFSAVLCGIGAVGTVRAVLREADFLRARRTGVELQAEVIDNDAKPTTDSGQYYLTPVVRYSIQGRTYEAELVNASGLPGSRGSFMTIVVNPARPYEPYDRYQGMGATSRGWVLMFLIGTALLAWALTTL